MQHYNLNYSALRRFLEGMYEGTKGFSIANSIVSGTSLEVVSWKMDLGFTKVSDTPVMAMETGQQVVMKGVSLQHWREEPLDGSEGKSWKVWKQTDDFVVSQGG